MSLTFLKDYNCEDEIIRVECPQCGYQFKYNPQKRRTRTSRQATCNKCDKIFYIKKNKVVDK